MVLKETATLIKELSRNNNEFRFEINKITIG